MIEPTTAPECAICADMGRAIKRANFFENMTIRALAYRMARIDERQIVLFDAYVLRSERIRRRLFPARKMEAA